jgi:hypothetical protein
MTSKAVRRRQLALVFCRAQSLGPAIKLTDMREITHYVWVHPGEERYAATGSSNQAAAWREETRDVEVSESRGAPGSSFTVYEWE